MARLPLLALLLPACTTLSKPVESGDSATLPGSDTATTEAVSAGLAGLAEVGARNLVVVQVDTFRADVLPFYGSPRDTMPLTEGRHWLVLPPLTSAASWTVPSTVSLLTALDPARHGVTHVTTSGDMNAPLTVPTAASWFADAGYATMILSGNVALGGVDGLYATFADVAPTLVGGFSPDLAWEVDDTLAWVDRLDPNQPFYVHLQPMDLHSPYRPDRGHAGTFVDPASLPFDPGANEDEQLAAFRAAYAAAGSDEERAALDEQLAAVYAEQMLDVDEQLDALVRGLEVRGHGHDTLIVLIGDHGETLNEEASAEGAYFGHGSTIRPELVRVPFLVYNPALPAEDRDPCVARNVDVMPTMLRALGLPDVGGLDGVPLQDGCRSLVRSSLYAQNDPERLAELGVGDGASMLRFDCVRARASRYDLVSDPTGRSPVPAAKFPAEETLQAEMATYIAEIDAARGTGGCVAE